MLSLQRCSRKARRHRGLNRSSVVPQMMLERRKGMAGPAIVREIARALGESATLAEAAPRMLADVCESLGWEYGALWEVDRGGKTLKCVGTWHASSLRATE